MGKEQDVVIFRVDVIIEREVSDSWFKRVEDGKKLSELKSLKAVLALSYIKLGCKHNRMGDSIGGKSLDISNDVYSCYVN